MLQRAGGEARGRVAMCKRQHRAGQRLLLLSVALSTSLRNRHCAVNKNYFYFRLRRKNTSRLNRFFLNLHCYISVIIMFYSIEYYLLDKKLSKVLFYLDQMISGFIGSKKPRNTKLYFEKLANTLNIHVMVMIIRLICTSNFFRKLYKCF